MYIVQLNVHSMYIVQLNVPSVYNFVHLTAKTLE